MPERHPSHDARSATPRPKGDDLHLSEKDIRKRWRKHLTITTRRRSDAPLPEYVEQAIARGELPDGDSVAVEPKATVSGTWGDGPTPARRSAADRHEERLAQTFALLDQEAQNDR